MLLGSPSPFKPLVLGPELVAAEDVHAARSEVGDSWCRADTASNFHNGAAVQGVPIFQHVVAKDRPRICNELGLPAVEGTRVHIPLWRELC